VVTKPANISFELAAAVPVAALTALQALRDEGRIQPGQKVLINGAAGGVGTFAVQIAKSLGADVTGVCSTRNLRLVQSIGADRAIDYTKENFTKSGEEYDLIFDLIANHSLSECRRALKRKGRYVIAGVLGASHGQWVGPLAPLLKAFVTSWFVRQKLVPFFAKLNKDDLIIVRDLIQGGKVIPVIDRLYNLSAVPEAIRRLEGCHARGKVIVTVG